MVMTGNSLSQIKAPHAIKHIWFVISVCVMMFHRAWMSMCFSSAFSIHFNNIIIYSLEKLNMHIHPMLIIILPTWFHRKIKVHLCSSILLVYIQTYYALNLVGYFSLPLMEVLGGVICDGHVMESCHSLCTLPQ